MTSDSGILFSQTETVILDRAIDFKQATRNAWAVLLRKSSKSNSEAINSNKSCTLDEKSPYIILNVPVSRSSEFDLHRIFRVNSSRRASDRYCHIVIKKILIFGFKYIELIYKRTALTLTGKEKIRK